jgi:ribosome-interacting GTPase 1
MDYDNVKIQIIDQASLKNENFDIGLVNNTDLIIIVVTNTEDIKNIQDNYLQRFKAKQIIVFNKIDLLNEQEKRRIESNLKSKKYSFIMVSCTSHEGIKELKEKIFSNFDIIRIYLKEPNKEPSKIPLIMKPGSTIKDVSDKISKQMLNTIKEIHIWGPSSKFPNQKVGISHQIKDKDIIEFKTR